MARRVAAGKPSLSDVVLADEDQILITNQIRAQFDSIAPKRPTKPSRSEPDSSPQNPPQEIASQQAIPELNKLLNLQSQSHGLHLGEGDSLLVQEEYVETQYYKELDSVEKRHHKLEADGGVGSYRWGLKEEKMKVLKLDLLMVQMGEFIFMEDIKAILQLMTGYQKLVVMII
ncbi:uncharacterized protein LOC111017922 isoform X2 [Momordica charantia]|uniref:Uncharacterized protein LOC111017922 isoform X2 n=1 Tax=Momordica charantia TaxID=3673 RepID=A0A6J1D859_MOMCH|nr:uncharacterized protein LOC111017922 isoform X2 [Momordica charantia]